MIDSVVRRQQKYQNGKTKADLKEIGQFFTSSAVADYMASLIESPLPSEVRLLDAGAGAGILTVSAVKRCLDLGVEAIHAVLYELDDKVIDLLRDNMLELSAHSKSLGGKFTFEIRNEDFVLSRPDRIDVPFHLSLINPPYFKYNSSTSPYAKATSDLFRGNPNIYASFMAVVTACLSPGGQMVAIVPRSFCNGLYFKGFRHFLHNYLSLDTIHIFRSRDNVFREAAVLQENIICSFRKCTQGFDISIRTSVGYEDLEKCQSNVYSASLLLDSANDNEFIRIPESQVDAAILHIVEDWPSSFESNGYFISTGPVVEHRTREFIVPPNTGNPSVPLLRMHNVKPFRTVWTGSNKKDARFLLSEGHEKHTTSNQPYVILKRFSSKDEKRRLVAGVHIPKTVDERLIALENHLNYIGKLNSQLDTTEAYGLAALLNSTLMDRYFRCISGNTQVNSTEIRALKLPSCEDISKLGAMIMDLGSVDQNQIDLLLDKVLQVEKSLSL